MKTMKKQQQTHLAQLENGEIYLTLDYLGKNNYGSPLELLDYEETNKTAKKEKYRSLQP